MYKKTFLMAFIIMAANVFFTWFSGERWDLAEMDTFILSDDILPSQWQIPILSLIFLAVMWGVQYLDPHRKNLENSKGVITVSTIGLAIICLILQASIILLAADIISESVSHKMSLATVYCVLIGMGNYLSTARRSYLSGLPTPWTMKSDLSWAKTHRLLGRSIMLISVVSFITTLMFDTKIGATIFLTSYAVVLVAAIFYSYLVWKKECERNTL